MEKEKLQQFEETKLGQEKPKETFEDTIEDGKIRIQVNQTEAFVKTNYTNNQNIHLNNSIRFADTKAGALVAVNGLIGKIVVDAVTAQTTPYIKFGFILGLLFIIAGIALSVWVVFPKKENSKVKGIIYWENIVAMEQEEYIEAIEGMDAKEIRKQGLINNYIQSKILTKKFTTLHYAFVISLIGYFLSIIAALVTLFIG